MSAPDVGLWRSDLILLGDEAFTPEEWAAIPHGRSSGYVRHGCRCDDCRAWRKAYYHDKEAARGPR